MEKKAGGSGGIRCAIAALIGLLGFGALILLGGAAWVLTHQPDMSAELSASLNPAQVNIIQPTSGQSLMLDEALTVYARAFGGMPVEDVELYVDGKRLGGQQADFPAGATKVTASWVWTPHEAGAHVLTARVRTVAGGGNVSNPVTVKALAEEDFPPSAAMANIDEAEKPDEAELAALTEAGEPVSPPPGGDGGQAGEPPEPEEPEQIQPPGQQPGGNILPGWIIWIIGHKLGWLQPTNPPEAPLINGLAQDCHGMLVVKDNADNEAGFFLYRLSPGMFVFERVATLDGKGGKKVFSYADQELASGTYFYYVAAFNVKGEAPSNVVSVKVEGSACDTVEPKIFEPESIPVDAAQPTDKAYCYGSADGMPWMRLPVGQNHFMTPVNGKYDLAPYWDQIPLPKPLPPKFLLNMECWGWSGDTLVYLGASSKEFIAEKEAKKPQPGEPSPVPGGEENGKGGGPKVAAPYNLAITMDASQCTTHNTKMPQYIIDQCYEFMGKGKSVLDPDPQNQMLMWDWSRYDGCAPGDAVCEAPYIDGEGFTVYRIRSGVQEPLQSMNMPMSFWMLFGPSMRAQPGDDFFVRANGNSVESDDSNHVVIGPSQQIILGASGNEGMAVLTHQRKNKYGNGWVQTPPVSDQWFLDTDAGIDILGGYARLPGAGGLLYTTDWYGRIRFDLPQDVVILSAKIKWKWVEDYTDGPGKNDRITACKTYMGVTAPGGAAAISGITWGDQIPYDVTGLVANTQMQGKKQMEIWFTHKPGFSSGDIPYACYLRMGDIKLILDVASIQ